MPLPIEINVASVQEMLNSAEKFTLLDVREPEEVATAKIAGSTHIPMKDVPPRIAELGSKDARIIVHCHHGGRSLRVTNFLRLQGYPNVQNMTGGIDAWSTEIDPTIPRYQ